MELMAFFLEKLRLGSETHHTPWSWYVRVSLHDRLVHFNAKALPPRCQEHAILDIKWLFQDLAGQGERIRERASILLEERVFQPSHRFLGVTYTKMHLYGGLEARAHAMDGELLAVLSRYLNDAPATLIPALRDGIGMDAIHRLSFC
jgi:hypothetical protein